MNSPKPKRKRGVILTLIGWEKLQRSIRDSEIEDNFGSRYTLEQLSSRTRLDPDTIAKVTNCKVGVDKRTLELFLQAFNLELTASDYFKPSNPQPSHSSSHTREDLSQAVDSFFLGRTTELAQLQQWILGENCRLVAILGMGGIGKTALSVKLAQQIKHKFEYIIWRSLRTAPPIEDLLAGLILFLSNEQVTETDLPKTVDETISLLIKYLQNHRCLLILDNLEAILQSGEHTGYYRPGYEGYGELIKRIGEINHQSCVVITSREKPEELALLEGETLPVRCLQLTGLQQLEGQEILKAKGVFGTEAEINKIIDYYRGNPLALKIIATSIKELFAGDISEFLTQGTNIFRGIGQLLEQQFHRLSTIEKHILYWLAINQEPISIAELQDDFVPSVAKQNLLEALESLSRRSIIERSRNKKFSVSNFTLQPVVMEYVTDSLIQQICAEIVELSEGYEEKKISSPQPQVPSPQPLFNTHALIKAQAKEYVRDTQIRLILKAVIDKLLSIFNTNKNIEKQLIEIISTLRQLPPQPGYAAGNILNLLCQMEINLTGYDFSDLSIWQANLQNVNLHNVNFQNADLAKSVFAETLGGVLSVATSQDGKLLATGDANGDVHIWQIEDGKQLVICKGHTGWIRSVAFSPDNSMIVSGCSDHAVRLWDVRDGKCLRILHSHTNRVRSVCFHPGGNISASGSDDCTIKLWDVRDGKCLITLHSHTNRVRSVAFHPGGNILASGSDDCTVKLWDVKTGKILRTLQAHKDGVRAVTFSPNGLLATGGEDTLIKLWDVRTGKCLSTLQGHSDGVWSLAFSPIPPADFTLNSNSVSSKSSDNEQSNYLKSKFQSPLPSKTQQGNPESFLEGILASGSHDQTIKLWDIKTGQILKTLQGHTSWVWSVVFAADGQTLVSGGADQTAKLWDIDSGQCIKTWQGRSNGVWAVAFCPVEASPNEYIIASVSDDKTLRLWDISSGQTLKSFRGHRQGVWSIAINPRGNILASGSDDQTVRLWDINTGQVRILQGHTGWVWSVAFSLDGSILASSGADQTIRLWDVTTGQTIRILQGHTNIVRSVAFSQNGQIASGSVDQTVRLWDINTGELAVLQGHTRPISSVAFSSDGIVASGSDDGTVKLWDVSTGKCIQTLEGHTDWIQSVALCPEGNILASGSHDQTIKLWDVNNGQLLRTLTGHTGWVWSVAFCPIPPNPRYQKGILASSSQDGTIKIWDVLTGECLKTFRSERPLEGMNITGATSLTEAQKATLKALGAVEFESAVGSKVVYIRHKTSKNRGAL